MADEAENNFVEAFLKHPAKILPIIGTKLKV